jgi:hypothetical protein
VCWVCLVSFAWKELWLCFHLRKEHGEHTHSFLKWETLAEFNRSFVWARNSELCSMGDDFGFAGQDSKVYLPNFLGLAVQHRQKRPSPVSGYWVWCDFRQISAGVVFTHLCFTNSSVWVSPIHNCPRLWLHAGSGLLCGSMVSLYLISSIFTHFVNRKSMESTHDVKIIFSIWNNIIWVMFIYVVHTEST